MNVLITYNIVFHVIRRLKPTAIYNLAIREVGMVLQ